MFENKSKVAKTMELVAHEVKQGEKRFTSENFINTDQQNISKKNKEEND